MTDEELLSTFPDNKDEIYYKLLFNFNKDPAWANVMMYLANFKTKKIFTNFYELANYITDFILQEKEKHNINEREREMPMTNNSNLQVVNSLKSVIEHLPGEQDKGIVNNAIFLIQELSYNEVFLVKRLKECKDQMNEYRRLLQHFNAIKGIINGNDLFNLSILDDMCFELDKVPTTEQDKKEQNKADDWE